MTTEPTFEGQASHPGFGDQTAAGEIVLGSWTLRFSSALGEVELPLRGLLINYGTGDDDEVFFSHPEFKEWTVYTADRSILDHPIFQQRTELKAQLRKRKDATEKPKALIVTLGFLAVLLILGSAFSVLSGVGIRWVAAGIPVSFEKALGDRLAAKVRKEETLVDDPKYSEELTALMAPVLAAIPKTGLKFEFHVVEDRWPNAFALPGGHVFVNTGLFELASEPEELAGVLAHEIAHVTQKHGFRKIVSAAGPFLVVKALFGDRGGLIGLIADSSQILVRESFSRDFEREADEVAFRHMVAAKVDPRGLAQALRKLKAASGAESFSSLESSAFSSHPPTNERIRRLEQAWSTHNPKSGFVPLPKLTVASTAP